MRLYRPADWDDAVTMRSTHLDATPIAGGTDVMVAINRDHVRPPALLDLSRIAGLADKQQEAGGVRLGAGTTYTDISEAYALALPGFAAVARGVGSRQIRNRGTVGGALGTASPTGDIHPMMLAAEADVELRSVRGSRRVSAQQFYTESESGLTALRSDELIATVHIPAPTGPQRFLRIGLRQGLVKSLCSVAVAVDVRRRRVRVGIGSAGARPCRGIAAEQFVATAVTAGVWDAGEDLSEDLVHEFGELVAG
ncbi:MAG TPA: FAD binding domain-containing protein, partial [Micromonosporaceae bacterium]